MSASQQKEQLDLLNLLNRGGNRQTCLEDEMEARIQSFELAFRMQAAAPKHSTPCAKAKPPEIYTASTNRTAIILPVNA